MEKNNYLKEWREKNKDHIKKYRKEYYLKNKEKISLNYKKYYKNKMKEDKDYNSKKYNRIKETHKKYKQKNKDYYAKKAREYRKNNEDKIKARNIINNLKISFEVCSNCGKKSDKIEKHHEDYSSPKKIIPLCVKCHGEIHRIKRRCENS